MNNYKTLIQTLKNNDFKFHYFNDKRKSSRRIKITSGGNTKRLNEIFKFIQNEYPELNPILQPNLLPNYCSRNFYRGICINFPLDIPEQSEVDNDVLKTYNVTFNKVITVKGKNKKEALKEAAKSFKFLSTFFKIPVTKVELDK